MSRICHRIAGAIFAFFLVLGALLILPPLFHQQPYIVADSGMEPELSRGGLAFAWTAPGEEAHNWISPQDIICYDLDGSGEIIATKRVQVVDYQDEQLYVKNDKSGSIDEKPVPMSSVLGRVDFCVPLLGYFLSFLKTGPGIVTLCLLLAVLVFAVFLPELFYMDGVENPVLPYTAGEGEAAPEKG